MKIAVTLFLLGCVVAVVQSITAPANCKGYTAWGPEKFNFENDPSCKRYKICKAAGEAAEPANHRCKRFYYYDPIKGECSRDYKCPITDDARKAVEDKVKLATEADKKKKADAAQKVIDDKAAAVKKEADVLKAQKASDAAAKTTKNAKDDLDAITKLEASATNKAAADTKASEDAKKLVVTLTAQLKAAKEALPAAANKATESKNAETKAKKDTTDAKKKYDDAKVISDAKAKELATAKQA